MEIFHDMGLWTGRKKGKSLCWEYSVPMGHRKDGQLVTCFLLFQVYRMMSAASKWKVSAFCDIDEKKIGRVFTCDATARHINVLDYRLIAPPFIVCVASKRSGGALESNISSLGFLPVRDFIQFCWSKNSQQIIQTSMSAFDCTDKHAAWKV